MPSRIKTIIELRYDTFENWTSNNPVLNKGELAIYTKGERTYARVGDGTNTFSKLSDIGNWDAKYTIADITDLKDYSGSTHGLVPAGKGESNKYLTAAGTWTTPPDTKTVWEAM